MQKRSAFSAGGSGGASRVRRRALLGTAVLLVLVAVAGLVAHLTRSNRASAKAPLAQTSPAALPASSSASPSSPGAAPSGARASLPVPPSTSDPIAFGKAAAVALWSYDTRAYSQPQLLAALHGWLTGEMKYADPGSVDALVPSPVLWGRMADNGQYAAAGVDEVHFPASFTQAMQADPGAITTAYVYAVTVTGRQSIGWNGTPAGGAETRTATLAVQCRPSQPCALVGVLPAVAP
ncbi:hypothetical protein [Kitasatospora sp. LaBMicrA B282]|uniref:hypothetical protein n=1 Tax=Kitasatospora sp. LaBMicrA B282 TaxID=3420949 RepID=UPI003D12306D